MPPKKKKSSNKKKKEDTKNKLKEKTEWDDLDVASLEQVVSTLSNSFETSLQERIRAQTEYETVYQTYYERTKQDVSTMELKIKAKEMEIEDMIRDQDCEIQVYQEKGQFMQYDHERNLDGVNEQRVEFLNDELESHKLNLAQNEKDELTMKTEIRERETVYLEEIKNTKEHLEQNLNQVNQKLDNQLEELHRSCISQQEEIKGELDLQRSVELREMSETNNLQLYELDQRHGQMYNDTQIYYTNVSRENTARIERLNSDLKRVEDSILNFEAQSRNLEEENSRLKSPLSEYLSTVDNMKIQTRDKEKDKQSSISVKARIILIEERIRKQLQELNTLQQKYDDTEAQIKTMKTKQNQKNNSSRDQSYDKISAYKKETQLAFTTLKSRLEDLKQQQHEYDEKNNQRREHEFHDLEKKTTDIQIEKSSDTIAFQQLKVSAQHVYKELERVASLLHCQSKSIGHKAIESSLCNKPSNTIKTS